MFMLNNEVRVEVWSSRVSGDLQNLGIHFEEFSMLFQSLERELQ
jgi:hypothetical protein